MLCELAVRAVGSDIDPVRLAMRAANLAALGMEGPGRRADVLHPATATRSMSSTRRVVQATGGDASTRTTVPGSGL